MRARSAALAYRVPGRAAALVVRSSVGDPFAGGDEVRRCGWPCRGVRRLDGPNGVLPWPLPR